MARTLVSAAPARSAGAADASVCATMVLAAAALRSRNPHTEFESHNRVESAVGLRQPESMLNGDECWEALTRRDRGCDGAFFFGVLSTGVYCRPSCPARRPLRRNVRFYGTPAEAERDGLRPCLRCRPLEAVSTLAGAKVLELCGYLEGSCR